MTRRETLVELLRRFEEAREVSFRDGSGGGGGLVPLMPLTWTASYRELERCLVQLRSEHRTLYRHLHARYLDPWRMRLSVPVRKGGELRLPTDCELAAGQPSVGLKTADVIVNVWPGWVDMLLVGAALDELERLFVGEPFLPAEFVAA